MLVEYWLEDQFQGTFTDQLYINDKLMHQILFFKYTTQLNSYYITGNL
jgi:hypothetical protein